MFFTIGLIVGIILGVALLEFYYRHRYNTAIQLVDIHRDHCRICSVCGRECNIEEHHCVDCGGTIVLATGKVALDCMEEMP